MPIPFNNSPGHTLGVEIESGLVHDKADELECAAPAQAHADQSATVAELDPILRRRHLELIGTGIPWPARRMLIHGVHFHVGVPSGDHAVAGTNALSNTSARAAQ